MRFLEAITIEFQADSRLSKNGLRRAHWRSSQPLIREARERAFILGRMEMEGGWVTPDRCRVDVRQFWAGKPYDWDGLATLCASTLDGLVDAGVMPVDDDPTHVVSYAMTAERVQHRADSRIAVTVTPVSV